MGHAVAQLVEALRYNWKVAGSIPDGVIGICHWVNISGLTMTLDLTQTLKTLVPSCAAYLEIWELQPPGTLKPVQVCNGIALPSPFTLNKSGLYILSLLDCASS